MILNSCAYLCSLALIQIDSIASIDTNFSKNSKLIKDILMILIDAHSELVRNFDEPSGDPNIDKLRTLQSKRCIGLIDLIRSVSDKNDLEVLELQEMVFFK